MHLDATLLTSFRARFEAKEPDPKNFIRRVTRLDIYLTVEDLVEDRRSKGFAWEGIAEDFTALGVKMSVATLKTCFRRARERKRGNSAARPKLPVRRSNRLSRVERVPRSAGDPVEVITPLRDLDSLALAVRSLSNPTFVAAPENAKVRPIPRPIERGSQPAHTQDPEAAPALAAVIASRQPCLQDEQALASSALPSRSSPPSEPAPVSQGSRKEIGIDASSFQQGSSAKGGGGSALADPLLAETSVALADDDLLLSAASVSEDQLRPQTSRQRKTQHGSVSHRAPHPNPAALAIGEASSTTPLGRHGLTPGGQRSAAFPIKAEIPHNEL